MFDSLKQGSPNCPEGHIQPSTRFYLACSNSDVKRGISDVKLFPHLKKIFLGRLKKYNVTLILVWRQMPNRLLCGAQNSNKQKTPLPYLTEPNPSFLTCSHCHYSSQLDGFSNKHSAVKAVGKSRDGWGMIDKQQDCKSVAMLMALLPAFLFNCSTSRQSTR